jgi:hypothetical protein
LVTRSGFLRPGAPWRGARPLSRIRPRSGRRTTGPGRLPRAGRRTLWAGWRAQPASVTIRHRRGGFRLENPVPPVTTGRPAVPHGRPAGRTNSYGPRFGCHRRRPRAGLTGRSGHACLPAPVSSRDGRTARAGSPIPDAGAMPGQVRTLPAMGKVCMLPDLLAPCPDAVPRTDYGRLNRFRRGRGSPPANSGRTAPGRRRAQNQLIWALPPAWPPRPFASDLTLRRARWLRRTRKRAGSSTR